MSRPSMLHNRKTRQKTSSNYYCVLFDLVLIKSIRKKPSYSRDNNNKNIGNRKKNRKWLPKSVYAILTTLKAKLCQYANANAKQHQSVNVNVTYVLDTAIFLTVNTKFNIFLYWCAIGLNVCFEQVLVCGLYCFYNICSDSSDIGNIKPSVFTKSVYVQLDGNVGKIAKYRLNLTLFVEFVYLCIIIILDLTTHMCIC